MKNLVFLVPAVAMLLSAGSVPSAASPLLDEFRASKQQIQWTLFDSISVDGWSTEANKRLIDTIDGAWIRLSSIDLSGSPDLAKACHDQSLRFSKIDNVSFAAERPDRGADKPIAMRAEYVNRSGASYSIRRDLTRQPALFGPEVTAEQREFLQKLAASTANQEVVLLLLTPNVLLEVVIGAGFPELYGRCPSESWSVYPPLATVAGGECDPETLKLFQFPKDRYQECREVIVNGNGATIKLKDGTDLIIRDPSK